MSAPLPGVGRNLQDHPLVTGMNFRARDRLGLPRDNGGGAVMNWRSSAAPRPDLHAFVAQGAHACPEAPPRGTGWPAARRVRDLARPDGLGSVGCLTVRAVSGRARARSRSARGFLTEQADVDALVEAVDIIMDLAATSAYAALIDKPLVTPGRLGRAGKIASSGSTARRCTTRAAPPPWAPARTRSSTRRWRHTASTACGSRTPR